MSQIGCSDFKIVSLCNCIVASSFRQTLRPESYDRVAILDLLESRSKEFTCLWRLRPKSLGKHH